MSEISVLAPGKAKGLLSFSCLLAGAGSVARVTVGGELDTATALRLDLAGALAFGLGGRGVAARLLGQAYEKGQENKDEVKQDMQLGKGRAQEQAEKAKRKADDGSPQPTGSYRQS